MSVVHPMIVILYMTVMHSLTTRQEWQKVSVVSVLCGWHWSISARYTSDSQAADTCVWASTTQEVPFLPPFHTSMAAFDQKVSKSLSIHVCVRAVHFLPLMWCV